MIEESGIPTILISALPDISKKNGSPRAIVPIVPIGANAGAPHQVDQQRAILLAALEHLVTIDTAGEHVPISVNYLDD